MVDWFYIGYCTVMAMFAVAFAYAAAFGLRALRRLPRSILLGFVAAATVATLTAQKTNNVPPNMNQPQMQQGGGVSQTGFTGLAGFGEVGENSSSWRNENSTLQLQLETPTLNPVQTTLDDIARGWRVECAATNENISYEMPSNATLVGNWHVHGAASSSGNNRIDFGDWRFPLGTNDEAFSSLWYLIDGRIRPTPKDAVREICAVGVPMSAVPGQSRLWRLDGDDGSRILTWENFFLGGDTNAPVNAQIVLYPNGDFVTRSNEVETVCRRVNPDDWDDDGIANDEDANPTACDGDFFGPANILPEGANMNAYCTVSLVATGPDTLVTFAGDKPSNYPDPRFVAKSGVTNEVVILIGKTYAISSDWPFAVVGVSDSDTEVWQMRGSAHQTYVRRPVTISASDGNPFTMSVVPLNLGGVFLWPSAQCHCSISGSGGTFTWNCPMDCTCCGCAVDGQYSYEGYWLPATSCLCGCHYDGTGPMWEPSSAPLAASVSASFSKSAVIFEDAYENQPGQWVGKNSTRTRLNIVANGGPNGGTLSVTSANIGKLSRISGPDLPLASVAVPAETQVSYAIVYEGATASDATNDVVVSATLSESGVTNLSVLASVSIVEVKMLADVAAPSNSCARRHMYGVHEKVNVEVLPLESEVGLSFVGGDGFSYYDSDCFWCPWTGGVYSVSFVSGDAALPSSVNVFDPIPLVVDAWWNGVEGTNGIAGTVVMNMELLLAPLTVSFMSIWVVEIPDETEGCPHFGYFDNPIYGRPWSHTTEAGAGEWFLVTQRNEWTHDRAGTAKVYPAPWSSGWKEWDIPIGWSDRIGEIKGRSRPNSEIERFEIDQSGAVTIRKFGHWIKRAPNNRVWVDGRRVN